MVYIHVPFCRSFCIYCDFYSEIARDDTVLKKYVDRVVSEIEGRKDELSSLPHTLYIGGGTPSVLPSALIGRLAGAVGGAPFEEFTLEANPEDIHEKGIAWLEEIKELGVNRLSFGVQSFDDGVLKWMNRRHDSRRAIEAFRMARKAGFGNISLDLIFGIPAMSLEQWECTLDTALSLRPEHLSCYQLGIEEGTALDGMLRNGKCTAKDDEACAAEYKLLCDKMSAAGYHHYEISNFALPGFESVHNSAYWERVAYAGFGAGAHSFDGKRRRSWNTPSLLSYVSEGEDLDDEAVATETVMLSLRTDKGVEKSILHGYCSQGTLERMIAEGKLREDGGRLRIPEDRFFVSDAIIRELI